MKETIRIGIIGTGFGQSTMLPSFRRTAGAEVVAIASARRERAEAAAQANNIAMAFDDYRAMLAEAQLDLVCIATPVVTHAPITLAAIAAGCHVLCEKPMAMDRSEAVAMLQAATDAGVVHMIDHELRFNPTRAKIAELLANGSLGRVYHIHIRSISGMRGDPSRAWDWWSDRSRGGGALAANGSHQVDLLRWWLGEITAVSGQLNTFVTARPDPAQGGALRAVDSDDQFSFSARFANGAQASVFVSYVAHYGGTNQVEIHGERGSLLLDQADRLWGKQLGGAVEELTVPDPLEGAPDLPNSVWARSFAHLAQELVPALREGRAPQRGATFLDGLRCQQVLDAVRQSHVEERWIAVHGE
ncbi:Gfo/Idh/MocA family oxidoreductase [Candidatus Gracilibacteria bacterium]|nr:Gfo/Idh/MocA family oxidoreductase [Candidatus Gracilibacteria bacterium]